MPQPLAGSSESHYPTPFFHSLWTLRPTEFKGKRDAALLSSVPSFTVEEMELRQQQVAEVRLGPSSSSSMFSYGAGVELRQLAGWP